MIEQATLRPTTRRDLAAVDALLAASFPKLLKHDYPPSVLVTCLPLMSRAQPTLLQSGTYYTIEGADGTLLSVGVWTMRAPVAGMARHGTAHVRHVATHPNAVRQGYGRALLEHSFREAKAAGAVQMLCQSTRTATPFYTSLGFTVLGQSLSHLRPGITLPVVDMVRPL